MSINRINRINTLLKQYDLDALVLNPGPTLTYLTGLHFHLMERPFTLILSHSAPSALILPEFEQSKTEAATIPLDCFTYQENPLTWPAAYQKACQHTKLDGLRVGVESNRLRVLELRFLENAAPHANFISADEALGELRTQKDAIELDAMCQAAKIAQKALQTTLKDITIGMTEREIAAELVVQLLRAGSEPELPFMPIVASGPNSANPHATPSDRRIRQGDLLLIDWGASYQGYASDITRTFAIGEVDQEFEQIYRIVAEANAAGRAACRPGAIPAKIDTAARNVITAAGYAEFFTHRLGHGLGMEGHEPPYIHSGNQTKLKTGATFTIEPGVYIPGRGGIRIEDDVAITASGVESLTTLPRELKNIL